MTPHTTTRSISRARGDSHLIWIFGSVLIWIFRRFRALQGWIWHEIRPCRYKNIRIRKNEEISIFLLNINLTVAEIKICCPNPARCYSNCFKGCRHLLEIHQLKCIPTRVNRINNDPIGNGNGWWGRRSCIGHNNIHNHWHTRSAIKARVGLENILHLPNFYRKVSSKPFRKIIQKNNRCWLLCCVMKPKQLPIGPVPNGVSFVCPFKSRRIQHISDLVSKALRFSVNWPHPYLYWKCMNVLKAH